ncbi:serine metalloprotease MrpA [Cupriavidus basilensis OR16]|uniref:Serine metalloprotease MrpA n=1 Tax=Cupriavidus basilensis OR16 TaxID=1127483 RepID=H1RZU0_9BURK|nr:serine metalloprotease MrpA [Cupriavidus basilensis OR16]
MNGGWIPNDPNFAPKQWNLHDPAIPGNAKGAINAVNAWSSSKGDGIVIAILDNGVNATHPDLQGKLLPGYSFVTRAGRGTNTQPPAFGAQCVNPALQNGATATMAYHGTSMAGIAAAATNNGQGIAGVAPNSMVLPVKVLDECMSSNFDMADGIRWAAGLGVSGAPGNPHPARVISVSISSSGACGQTIQSAIQDAVVVGSVVVAGAGNDGGAVGNTGSCKGVIAVGAIDHTGLRASYSNFRPRNKQFHASGSRRCGTHACGAPNSHAGSGGPTAAEECSPVRGRELQHVHLRRRHVGCSRGGHAGRPGDHPYGGGNRSKVCDHWHDGGT